MANEQSMEPGEENEDGEDEEEEGNAQKQIDEKDVDEEMMERRLNKILKTFKVLLPEDINEMIAIRDQKEKHKHDMLLGGTTGNPTQLTITQMLGHGGNKGQGK